MKQHLKSKNGNPERVGLPRWLRSACRDRRPDFVIGENYLARWWIIPPNPIFSIYLHRITRSDDDRALHDHPGASMSLILKGEYREIVPDWRIRLSDDGRPILYQRDYEVYYAPKHVLRRSSWRPIFRRARDAHRIEITPGDTVWSLFAMGPRTREWGFHCQRGWIPWYKFVNPSDPGQVGPGCG